MLNFAELIEIKDEVTELMSSPMAHDVLRIPLVFRWLASNFTGVGVGFKFKDQKRTDKPALLFLVRSRMPEELLGPFHVQKLLERWKAFRKANKDEYWRALSEEGAHWKAWLEENERHWEQLDPENIDVIPTGALVSVGGQAGPVNQLTIGADVAMAGRSTHGTVCGFAKTEKCDGHFLLSSGHVLDGRRGRFSLVTSRGAAVATIFKQTDLLPGSGRGYDQQDAVLAKLLPEVDANYELPDHRGRLSSGIPEPASHGMRVTKAGKTVTEGEVACTHASVWIDYPSQVSRLRNQIVVESMEPRGGLFAQAGDSGALVMTSVTRRHWTENAYRGDEHGLEHPHIHRQLLPVGMVIAAGDPARVDRDKNAFHPQCAIVSPMADVLGALCAELCVR